MAPNRKRILLVEDEEDARDLVTLTLTEYTLICARNFDAGADIGLSPLSLREGERLKRREVSRQ
jgi:DNA-binding response OmpR family regulator